MRRRRRLLLRRRLDKPPLEAAGPKATLGRTTQVRLKFAVERVRVFDRAAYLLCGVADPSAPYANQSRAYPGTLDKLPIVATPRR